MPWPTEVCEFRPQESLKATISGLGAVDARLGDVLAAHGAVRPMLVCGSNVRRSESFGRVLGALNAAAFTDPVVFDGVRPHTPAEAVQEGAQQARDSHVDALIAVGGSSAVDCGKGIARLVVAGARTVKELQPLDFGRFDMTGQVRPGALPFITVTTTLSFAEFLPFWGARHASLGRKLPYADDGAVLRTVFLDGLIAEHTPDEVWAETGVKALDDTIAAFCRVGETDPFRDAIDISALAQLCHWLPRSLGKDRAAERQQVFTAAWMTKFALPRLARPVLGPWFSTAARHALGATYELAHGIGSCVALPLAIRKHAEATRDRQRQLAEALGWPAGDPPLEPGLTALLDALGVPRSLRQIGIDISGLDAVVDRIMEEAPQLGSREELRGLCNELW
jgi:alcohol dehydrogenase class IV